jgi:hypothetical protein
LPGPDARFDARHQGLRASAKSLFRRRALNLNDVIQRRRRRLFQPLGPFA